jgi:hypothetical protein
MDPITAGLIAGGIGLIGSEMTNSANTDIANSANTAAQQRQDQANQFNAQQYATRYQTTVKDLQAAGLNPMLAYGQGAGSQPTAQAAPVNVPAPRVNSLSNASQAFMSMQQNAADMKLKDEQQKLNSAQTASTNAQTLRTIADTAKVEQDTKTGAAVEQVNRQQLGAISASIARDRAAAAASTAAAARTIQEQNIRAPEEAKSKTWWGRNISPYIQDFTKTATSATQAAGAFR